MGKQNVSRETLEACGESGHIPPVLDCLIPVSEYPVTVSDDGIASRLGKTLFPLTLYQYRGRQLAMSGLLCVSVGTYERLAKRCGDGRWSLPMILRARKIIADTVARLSRIDRDLAKLETDRRSRPKRRGMFEVKVRDETGIPRTALARDGWRKKPGDLPKF